MRENIMMNGENVYSTCFSLCSIASMTSVWFRRNQIAKHMESVADTKLSRMQLAQMLTFHALVAVYIVLYNCVLIPWYNRLLTKCGASEIIKIVVSVTIFWGGLSYYIPVLLLLNSSFLRRIKFKNLNKLLIRYLERTKSTSSKESTTIKSLRNIRFRYTKLRNAQENFVSMLSISVLSNHLFILISFINTMLYLIVSIMEDRDQISYIIGVTGAGLGLVLIFLEASLIEMEGMEVRFTVKFSSPV